MRLNVDHILDLRGMIIPVTFLKVTQILRQMNSGEIVQIVGSDPDTRKDLFKILRTCSYELVDIQEDETLYTIRLKKGKPVSR